MAAAALTALALGRLFRPLVRYPSIRFRFAVKRRMHKKAKHKARQPAKVTATFSSDFDLLLQEAPIHTLRPTQMTIGFREVAYKRWYWRTLPAAKIEEYLARHVVPVVRGPRDRLYVTDHHHLTRALIEEAVERVFVLPIADFSQLNKPVFWQAMESQHWVHPYDANGERRDYQDIPKRVVELTDDPFRSLASALRRAGGYVKESAPYSEFAWADFLRCHIPCDFVEQDFPCALDNAVALARSQQTKELPGWRGG